MTKTHPITVRRSDERGNANHGWLESRHSFSFADYHDPAHMGFRSLRVINQDRVAPGGGFPTHPHRDMEIFSYVLEGELRHQDSMDNSRTLAPGEIQLMGAGSGVTHSEYNPSATNPLHFLQIWIQPRERGLTPGYTEWKPSPDADDDAKTLVISPDGRKGSAKINQDADVWRITLVPGQSIRHRLAPDRGLWLQVVKGPLQIGDTRLDAGDGASTETAGELEIRAADKPVEALLFDLA
jgi:redox-sensitive bicupin YhaK (pirin superfamily)